MAVLDLIPERLELAAKLGADGTFNVREDGVALAKKEIAGGGFDLVFEYAGAAGALETSLDLVRNGGTIYSYGVHAWPETIELLPWHIKGPRLLSNYTDPGLRSAERRVRLAEIALDWVGQGWWQVEELITTRPLGELQEAIRDATTHPEEILKIVMVA